VETVGQGGAGAPREPGELTPAAPAREARTPGERPPLGIILCAGKKRETVEILDLDARGIHVAEYLTELAPRKLLEERLHKAIESARSRIAPDKLGGPS